MSVDLVGELKKAAKSEHPNPMMGVPDGSGGYKAVRALDVAVAELERLCADVERLLAMLDEVATSSTHPDRDGPGCWWCMAEDGQPHEAGCKYAAMKGATQ